MIRPQLSPEKVLDYLSSFSFGLLAEVDDPQQLCTFVPSKLYGSCGEECSYMVPENAGTVLLL